MKLGIALKEARKKIGLNQMEAAKSIGISQTYLSQIENDKKKPATEMLEKICKSYSTDLAMVVWKSLNETNVKKNKIKLFRDLKPVIDKLINEVFS